MLSYRFDLTTLKSAQVVEQYFNHFLFFLSSREKNAAADHLVALPCYLVERIAHYWKHYLEATGKCS